jgi:hypothetical protein
MIFITREYPYFDALVKGVTEREMQNGGTIKTYRLSTRSKNQDGTFKYSTWFAQLFGKARDSAELLKEETVIRVYGFKEENTSRKFEDGTFSKANQFFNLSICDFEVKEFEKKKDETEAEDKPY